MHVYNFFKNRKLLRYTEKENIAKIFSTDSRENYSEYLDDTS